MARRRMHRGTRRFLGNLATGLVCLLVLGFGIKWLFSSPATDLTGKTVDPAAEAGPALKPIVDSGADTAAVPARTAVAVKPEPLKAAGGNSAANSPEPGAPVLPASAAKPKSDKPEAPVAPTTQPSSTPKLSPDAGKQEMDKGFEALDRKELVAARTHLNSALHSGLSPADEKRVREAMVELTQQTIFSRSTSKDDPLAIRHTVKSGESLARIARRHKISEHLLAAINNITNKNLIRAGTTIKVIDGPFNAAVDKSDHKLHLYLKDVYLRSFDVALGMDGSTPTGTWKVINHLENPDWVDPNGKRWHANDPKNPIGEFWIGLEGLEGEAVGKVGFGIHGTVEPETIGKDVSLGCVRLAADDIALVYKLLVPGASVATISE